LRHIFQRIISILPKWKLLSFLLLVSCGGGGLSGGGLPSSNLPSNPQVAFGGPVGGNPAAATGTLSANSDPECMDGLCFFLPILRSYYGYGTTPTDLLDINVVPVPPPPTMKIMSTEPWMNFYLLVQQAGGTKDAIIWDNDVEAGYLTLVLDHEGKHLCSSYLMKGPIAGEKYNAHFERVPLGSGDKITLLFYMKHVANPDYNPALEDSEMYPLQKPENCPEGSFATFPSDEYYKKFIEDSYGVGLVGSILVDYIRATKIDKPVLPPDIGVHL